MSLQIISDLDELTQIRSRVIESRDDAPYIAITLQQAPGGGTVIRFDAGSSKDIRRVIDELECAITDLDEALDEYSRRPETADDERFIATCERAR